LEVRRLLLIRRRRFGDLVLLLPALERARELFPQATITWLAQPEYRGFLAAAGTGVELWCPANWRVALRGPRRRFDLALEFHGELPCILLGRLLADRLAGYGIRGGGFLLDLEAEYDWGLEAAARQVRLVEAAAGRPPSSGTATPRLALAPEWRRAAAPLTAGAQGAYVVLHPGCAQPAKFWPPERWRALIARCRERGWEVVLTGGAEDRALCDWLSSGGVARNLCGRTDWGALAGVVAGAAAVTASDTGVAHLARALGVPAVTLFGPTDPAVWGGANQQPGRNLVRLLACSPCNRGRCPLPQAADGAPSPCMQAITVGEVFYALERIAISCQLSAVSSAAAAAHRRAIPAANSAGGGIRLRAR
ncbi:MAG: glycosyltransferase family 9 protein, partial [Terriglobales bacterium]